MTAHNAYTLITRELTQLRDPHKAAFLKRFFKTGRGDYAEGDKFLGITVPDQRVVARAYRHLDRSSLDRLLQHPIHEYRLTALVILVYQFRHGDETTKTDIFNYYLSRTAHINNWDLVDLSARDIVGEYVHIHPNKKKILYRLVRSSCIWERRIAIVSTWALIKNHHFDDTLTLSTMLLTDTHDLIHKAVGWMLREVGKRDTQVLFTFLDTYAARMPRTALRYAIEHFSPSRRKHYMQIPRRA